jgi:hypothetical protein
VDSRPRSRPFDHHVEPLFAGLGVGDRPAPRASRRGALWLGALLVLSAAGLLAWWMA